MPMPVQWPRYGNVVKCANDLLDGAARIHPLFCRAPQRSGSRRLIRKHLQQPRVKIPNLLADPMKVRRHRRLVARIGKVVPQIGHCAMAAAAVAYPAGVAPVPSAVVAPVIGMDGGSPVVLVPGPGAALVPVIAAAPGIVVVVPLQAAPGATSAVPVSGSAPAAFGVAPPVPITGAVSGGASATGGLTVAMLTSPGGSSGPGTSMLSPGAPSEAPLVKKKLRSQKAEKLLVRYRPLLDSLTEVQVRLRGCAVVRSDSDLQHDHYAAWQVAALRSEFMAHARTTPGLLTAKELRPLLRSLGDEPSSTALAALINMVDADGNSLIDFEEFVSILATRMTHTHSAEELVRAFQVR